MASRILSVVAVLLMILFVTIPSMTIMEINEYEYSIIEIEEQIDLIDEYEIVNHSNGKESFINANIDDHALSNQSEQDKICNRWDLELTEQEIDMLADIIFLESHTESEESMIAAIEVIFNRITHDRFPNTLEDVLSQSNPVQFTTWKIRHMANPTDKEYNAIYNVLYGETEVLSIDYVYFGRGKQNNNDPILIDNHWFCKC